MICECLRISVCVSLCIFGAQLIRKLCLGLVCLQSEVALLALQVGEVCRTTRT